MVFWEQDLLLTELLRLQKNSYVLVSPWKLTPIVSLKSSNFASCGAGNKRVCAVWKKTRTDRFDKRGLSALTTDALEHPKHQKHGRG